MSFPGSARERTSFFKPEKLMVAYVKNFTHPELNVEVVAIGGNYVLTHEKKITFNGRDILYFTGYAVFDTTCCGSGGCTYALVAGYIVELNAGKTQNGLPISRVEPIKNEKDHRDIQTQLIKTEKVQQVKFQ